MFQTEGEYRRPSSDSLREIKCFLTNKHALVETLNTKTSNMSIKVLCKQISEITRNTINLCTNKRDEFFFQHVIKNGEKRKLNQKIIIILCKVVAQSLRRVFCSFLFMSCLLEQKVFCEFYKKVSICDVALQLLVGHLFCFH